MRRAHDSHRRSSDGEPSESAPMIEPTLARRPTAPNRRERFDRIATNNAGGAGLRHCQSSTELPIDASLPATCYRPSSVMPRGCELDCQSALSSFRSNESWGGAPRPSSRNQDFAAFEPREGIGARVTRTLSTAAVEKVDTFPQDLRTDARSIGLSSGSGGKPSELEPRCFHRAG